MYLVVKASRGFDGNPYSGPTMTKAGYASCEFNCIEDARACADAMGYFNPVGFNVYSAETGELVYQGDKLK